MKATSRQDEPTGGVELPGFLSVAAAFVSREARTLLRNRFLHVFLVLALLGGFATTGFTPSVQAIPFILLQVTLYLVPLFGILIGLSSAQAELEEQPFLLSQPISRAALVVGKWSALGLLFCPVLFLAFLPGLIFSARPGALLLLFALSALLGGVFVALGFAVGLATGERSRGLIYALLVWLFLLIGFDLFVYAAAMVPAVQQQPLFWVAVLLLNPVDTVRIAMLFHLEEIPFAIPSDLRLVAFWVEHVLLWAFALCAGWMILLFFWSRRRINRREI